MRVRGAINNRDGGVTPWGTYLTCEANCHQYFANVAALPDDAPRKAVHACRGLPTGPSHRRWECYHARFDLVQEPSEPFRFGWVAGLNPRPVSPVSSPRNITFDLCGNLWIATADQASALRRNGGVSAVPVAGPECGYLRQPLSGIPGGAIASLTFTPNNHTLFCSVQHLVEGSALSDPSSTWPDRAIPPCPSAIAVEKTEGSRAIGS